MPDQPIPWNDVYARAWAAELLGEPALADPHETALLQSGQYTPRDIKTARAMRAGRGPVYIHLMPREE